MHLGGVVHVDFIACEPILLGLIRQRGVHKVCHILVGMSITATNDSTLSMFGRELAVRVAGLLDDIRSVLLLTFIFIDPFASRVPLSLCLFRLLDILDIANCIELHVLRVSTFLKIRHTYVRILGQLRHHKIDDFRAEPS